jgi:hypothetical protein
LQVTKGDPDRHLPTSVQKSYFMLSSSARAVLNTALRKYRFGPTDLIPVGGVAQLKPATRRFLTSIRSASISRARRPQLSELVTTLLARVRPCRQPAGQRFTSKPWWIRNKKLDEKIDARATVEQPAQQEAQATAEAPPKMLQ